MKLNEAVRAALQRVTYVEGEPAKALLPILAPDDYRMTLNALKEVGGRWSAESEGPAVVWPARSDARRIIEHLLKGKSIPHEASETDTYRLKRIQTLGKGQTWVVIAPNGLRTILGDLNQEKAEAAYQDYLAALGTPLPVIVDEDSLESLLD